MARVSLIESGSWRSYLLKITTTRHAELLNKTFIIDCTSRDVKTRPAVTSLTSSFLLLMFLSSSPFSPPPPSTPEETGLILFAVSSSLSIIFIPLLWIDQ